MSHFHCLMLFCIKICIKFMLKKWNSQVIVKLYFAPESPEVLLKKANSRFLPQSSEWAYEFRGPRTRNFEQGPQVMLVQAGGTMGFEKHCEKRIENVHLCLSRTYLFTRDNNSSKWLEGKRHDPHRSLSTLSTQPMLREVEAGCSLGWFWVLVVVVIILTFSLKISGRKPIFSIKWDKKLYSEKNGSLRTFKNIYLVFFPSHWQ